MNTPRTISPTDATDVRIALAARKRSPAKTTTAKKKKVVKKKAASTAKRATSKKKATLKKKTVKKKAAAPKRQATAKKKAVKARAGKKKAGATTKKKRTVKKAATTRKKATTAKKAVAKKLAAKKTATRKTATRPTVKKTVKKKKKAAPTRATAPTTGSAPAAEAPERRPPDADLIADTAPAAEADASSAPSALPIPPLPDEDEEIVPYEEEEPAAPAREAPAGTAPAAILEGIRRGEYHVSALGVLDDAQITQLARTQGLKVRERERRSETLYRLLQEAPAPRRPQNVFVEGLLELHPDGYGFLRNPDRNYSQHPEDVYVSAGLIRKLGLKPGHWVSGTAKPSRPGAELLALQFVEEVNHESASDLTQVTAFENLTVVFPDTRFLLEVQPEDLEMRVIDLFCPLGRGQRALIVSPPRAGKTVILQKLADAIAHNSPDVDIVVLLVDERPEEVTNMRRSVRGEVIASTFDRPASNHIRIAELVMEKVKRMVEYGRHVVLLLDSITRLGRAYNNTSGPSGRILTGGLEAKALTKPKRFFGAARNIEDGGSLTIVATALVETGSRMDDVIFEEFKGSGNMEIVLDRSMANARIWPAIDLPASGTRNEDLLLHPEELRRVNLMRKAMSGQDPQSVMDGLREQMVQFRTNAELLMSIG